MYLIFVILTQEARQAYSISQTKHEKTKQLFVTSDCSHKQQLIKERLLKYRQSTDAPNDELIRDLERIVNE